MEKSYTKKEKVGWSIFLTMIAVFLIISSDPIYTFYQQPNTVETRYSNGQIKEKYTTKKAENSIQDCSGNIIKEGLYESWYLNGMKESEITFHYNKRKGKAQFWAENGQLLEKCTFANDTLQSREK